MDASLLPAFQPDEINFLLYVLRDPEPACRIEHSDSHMTMSPQTTLPILTYAATKQHQVTCSMPLCNNAVVARGRCHSHGGRRRCRIKGCEKRGQKRGLCAKHGGSDRCIVPDCLNVARVAQRCAKHRRDTILL